MRTPSPDFCYKDLSADEIKDRGDGYLDLFGAFVEYSNKIHDEKILIENVKVDFNSLVDMFKRIDKRGDYYAYFHELEMSEAKEVALIIFWTIKFKPFFYYYENAKERNSTINERFAAYMLKVFVSSNTDSPRLKDFFEKAEERITYYFMNRDISKESLMFYITSIISEVDII